MYVKLVTPPPTTPPPEVHIVMSMEDANRLRVLARYAATVEAQLTNSAAKGIGIGSLLGRLHHELRIILGD